MMILTELTVYEKIYKELYMEYQTGKNPRSELTAHLQAMLSENPNIGFPLEALSEIWYDADRDTVWINSQSASAPETLLFRNFDFSSEAEGNNKTHHILMQPHQRYAPASFHSHDYYEFVYVTSGHCRNIFPDAVMDLAADELLFLPPGQVHALSVFQDDCIAYNFLVQPEALTQLLRKYPVLLPFFSHLPGTDASHQKGSAALRIHTDPPLTSRVCQLWNDYRSLPSELRTPFLTCGFEQLLILLAGQNPQDLQITRLEAPGATGEHLRNCIQAECATITLSELAWRYGYNYEHISRIIKKETGSSFVNLRRHCRIERAAGLLRDTELPIGQIMLECGYESRSSFFQNFRAEYGITPGEYRERNKS